MTTIFMNSLTQLVVAKLKHRWGGLTGQIDAYDVKGLKFTPYFHDTELSSAQAQVIDALENKVIAFALTGRIDAYDVKKQKFTTFIHSNDNEDKEIIKLLIAEAKLKVERVREEHNASASSETLTCLENISNAIESFYQKLSLFPFKFLDQPYKKTPEHIAYRHACHYLGLSKFHPDNHGSMEIRKQKEDSLAARLNALRKAIHPQDTLDEQKETTLQHLNDLSRDNSDIVKPKKVYNVPLALSMFGMRVEPPTATPGTLEIAISLAKKEINDLTELTADCSRASSANNIPDHRDEAVSVEGEEEHVSNASLA